jgi:hypothetical protein
MFFRFQASLQIRRILVASRLKHVSEFLAYHIKIARLFDEPEKYPQIKNIKRAHRHIKKTIDFIVEQIYVLGPLTPGQESLLIANSSAWLTEEMKTLSFIENKKIYTY